MRGGTGGARPDITLCEDRYFHSGTRQWRLRLERSRKQMLNSLLAKSFGVYAIPFSLRLFDVLRGRTGVGRLRFRSVLLVVFYLRPL